MEGTGGGDAGRKWRTAVGCGGAVRRERFLGMEWSREMEDRERGDGVREGRHPDQGGIRGLSAAYRVVIADASDREWTGTGEQRRLFHGCVRAPGARFVQQQDVLRRTGRGHLQANAPSGERDEATGAWNVYDVVPSHFECLRHEHAL